MPTQHPPHLANLESLLAHLEDNLRRRAYDIDADGALGELVTPICEYLDLGGDRYELVEALADMHDPDHGRPGVAILAEVLNAYAAITRHESRVL
jgi:hypothetical protein